MKIFTNILFLILLIFQIHCSSERNEKGTHIVDLSGDDWSIDFRDNPNYASPEYSSQNWENTKVPGNFRLLNKSQRGILWIRKGVDLNPEMYNQPMALYLGRVYDKDEVFFNGVLIGINGKKPTDSIQNNYAYGRKRVYYIPQEIIRKGQNTIAVKIDSEFRNIAGITSAPVQIVPFSNALDDIYNAETDDIIYVAFYFFIGLFFLINFWKMKEMKEYLFFSIFTFCFSLYLLFKNEYRFEIIDSFLLFKYLEYLVLFHLPYLYLIFIQEFFSVPKIKYQNIYYFVNLGFAVIFAIFRNPYFWDNFISIWSLHIVLLLGYTVLICQRKIIEKNREGIIFGVAISYFIYAIIKQILIERGFIDSDSSLDKAYFIFILFLTLSLRLRFIMFKLKIQKRFEQLKEVDSLRERIFKHMDKMMTTPLLHIRQIIAKLKAKDETSSIPEMFREMKSIHDNLNYTMDDILELSRLEVMAKAQYKETVNFVDFIRAVLPEGKITYSIKVDYAYEIHNSLDLINSIIMRLIDFPSFKEFQNIDLIITSDLKGQLHFRFMLYHKNHKVTQRLYEELAGRKSNENAVKWAIIKETLRLLEGHFEMKILHKKYLRIDFELQAVPITANIDITPKKEKRFKLPTFGKKKVA
ncbi:MAG: hypothetical protein L6Q54_01350 [Leptospiraceae bacterium]|nr:sensor histidine kinase [Leptospiraceae bacterium]MCK6379886.1 hypothetical protein [Leptospiraceae bacterium]NUM40233.1 sensor histidine kinase [Leptospiraceae bacterium]